MIRYAHNQHYHQVISTQGQPTIIFGEICVRKSQTVLRLSVLRCQTAIDFFTKTSPKRFATREKQSITFSERIFLQFLALKKVALQFRMSKWFAGKFFEGNVQQAISEMKKSFPNIFGHLIFS